MSDESPLAAPLTPEEITEIGKEAGIIDANEVHIDPVDHEEHLVPPAEPIVEVPAGEEIDPNS